MNRFGTKLQYSRQFETVPNYYQLKIEKGKDNKRKLKRSLSLPLKCSLWLCSGGPNSQKDMMMPLNP
jgi:hypothetical protein